MNKPSSRSIAVIVTALLITSCKSGPQSPVSQALPDDSLAGAWRSHIQFESGAFAPIKDLEFMYVFNAGGTMTESSNYDAAPPVPPAYGVWRRTAVNQFEARYEFYPTKSPTNFDDIKSGSGWLPAGRGVFSETITLSEDGNSFNSRLRYDALDATGQPVAGGGEAKGEGIRIHW